jgi:UDP-GlcNAc:undecaprenyl-phosphate GlcNAc-1-phosphate transferase
VTSFLYPFLVALGVAFAITPVVKRIAIHVGAFTKPSSRSVHTVPTPHLGGVAIYLAFSVATVLFGRLPQKELYTILAGGAAAVILGMIDDFRPLSPRVKLLGQVLIAAFAVICGVRIDFLTNPLGGLLLLGRLGGIFTVIWIVSFMNVVNLIDGIDGLAAGVSSIAAVTLLFVAFRQGQALAVLLTATLAGSALGFLKYNFNPAKIFMGDAGAHFLGFTLAAISIEGTLKSAAAVAIIVPVLALGLPILDTFFAIMRRLWNGQPVGVADRGHLHHRLLDMGLSQRQTCYVMYGISVLLGLAAVSLTVVQVKQAVLILGCVGTGMFVAARRAGVLETRGQQKTLKQ